MNDEIIIKRKLLFDGEGLGDDRRLNLLQKMIVRWIFQKPSSDEENQNIYNKICYQLSILEHSREKSELMKKNYEQEFSRYQKYQSEMKENINNINEAIESSKVLLLEVRNIKHKKLNYEMIARDISAEPSRQETNSFVKQLQQNLSKLKMTESKLENEWRMWKKHCSVITATAIQLKSVIDNSSSSD